MDDSRWDDATAETLRLITQVLREGGGEGGRQRDRKKGTEGTGREGGRERRREGWWGKGGCIEEERRQGGCTIYDTLRHLHSNPKA